jgi:hypothetical protein
VKTVFKMIFVFFGMFLFSCAEDNRPDFNKIESPRVVGLIADKPEANPNDVVTLTPIVSDLAATTGLQDSVNTCIDAGIALGADPTCDNNPTKQIIHANRTLTLPGVSENWTGLADSFVVTTPLDILIFNQRSNQDKYNGISLIVEYILHSPSGVNIKSIKRIVITESSKTTKNLNPNFTDIFSDNVTMTNLPLNSTVALTSDLANTSAENYVVKDAQGSLKNFTEQLAITWFITDGSTKYYRSIVAQSNEYKGPTAAPSGRSAYIMAVARDNRGGLALIKRKLN